MPDPSALTDEVMHTPEPFEGEQILDFTDFDLVSKPYGLLVKTTFRGENGDRATANFNLYKDPDDRQKVPANINIKELRSLFRALGLSSEDELALSGQAIANCLQAYVGEKKVKAQIVMDGSFVNAKNFARVD
jgi:hypothetical protein